MRGIHSIKNWQPGLWPYLQEQEEPGGAMTSDEEPGGARRSLEGKRSQEEVYNDLF
jgi:hypothetical protein